MSESRSFSDDPNRDICNAAKRRIVVLHAFYGCDTGCCGHVIQIDGEELAGSFQFSHPWLSGPRPDDPIEWAKEFVLDQMGPEHVADLDWENCVILDD